jgi:paraquat-inducible protein A
MEQILGACPACGLVLCVPALAPHERAICPRCDRPLADPATRADKNRRAWHATCAALVLYPVAVTQPILTLERLGHAHASSVLGGSLGLVREGRLALGLLVFACSVVLPLVKLGTLFVLLRWPAQLGAKARSRALAWLEWSGRFGMLDVLLVSILVAWLELGSWVEVRSGPAALAFALCVACSLLANAWLDPHGILEGVEEGA